MRFPAELPVSIPRRWAWAIGVGVALLAGLLVWLLLAGRSAALPVGEPPPGLAGVQERRVMGPVPLRTTTAPAPRATSVETARGVDEYEICGGHWVKANAEGEPDEAGLKRAIRRDEAAEAVDQALAADRRPVAQAARLFLRAVDAPAVSRDSLARFAATTADPAVYALAYRMCGSGRLRDGACGLLSAEQWARIDPGNAAPWQEVFAAAQARQDSSAANEALHRIATSQRSDQRFFQLPGLVVEAAPPDDGLRTGVFVLTMEAIGIQAAWPLPGYQPLVFACRRDALRDSNRRQTCEAVADLLAERSDTLIERTIGGAVGRLLGWPEERTERMRAELQAFASSGYAGVEPREAMGCDAIKRMNDGVRSKALLGEVGAMREWLAREAPPPDELLRRYRARQREAAEQTEAIAAVRAASAASTPG